MREFLNVNLKILFMFIYKYLLAKNFVIFYRWNWGNNIEM